MCAGHNGLPMRYRDDRLTLLAVDPNQLWAHWDEGLAIETLASHLFGSGWESAPRFLRLRTSKDGERLVACRGASGSLLVHGLLPLARYQVEYGVRWEDRFWPLLEASVELPGLGHTRQKSPRTLPAGISSYSIYSLA